MAGAVWWGPSARGWGRVARCAACLPSQYQENATMARMLVSSGSSFEMDIGYSRAVVDGDWVFVSGTTGFDYATMAISDEVVAQGREAMQKTPPALGEA